MSRKLSQISQQEMQALHDALSDIFIAFCASGAGQTGSQDMDGRKFAKFAKDTHLIDKKCTSTDIGLIFTRVKLKGKRTINFTTFQNAVRQIAIKKGRTYQELIMTASSAGGPGTTNVTKVAGGDQTRFDVLVRSLDGGRPGLQADNAANQAGNVVDVVTSTEFNAIIAAIQPAL
jgi:hypothetical protein